jgi:vacuolar-type H+-ATPase subunit E/Vma4
MTEFPGVLDLQVESLIDTLGARQRSRCKEIEQDAERRARQMLDDNRRKLRKRLHQAVDDERQQRNAALRDAERRIETAARSRTQERYGDFLEEAWPHLVDELRRRWIDPEHRRAWCEMLIAEAQDKIAPESWTVEVPESWSSDDERWMERAFQSRGLPYPTCSKDSDIGEGLRIRRDDACLDATLDGLLANRRAVKARLLAAWEERRNASAETDDD